MIEVSELRDGQVGIRHRFVQPSVLIGRHPENDLVLSQGHVSARHVKLTRTEHGVRVKELGSTNGTRVLRGGQSIPVDEHLSYELSLLPDDELLLGDPEQPVHLRVSVGPGQVNREVRMEDTAEIEVIARLDLSDEARVDALSSALERDALLLLHQFSSRAAVARRPQPLLEAFCQTVMTLLPMAERVRVFLEQSEDGGFEAALVRGRSGPEPKRPLSGTLERLIRSRREAVSFAMGDPKFQSAESLQRIALGAGMCVPVWAGARVVGVAQVESARQHRVPFSEDDLQLLAVAVGQLGLALHNLRLNANLETTIGELKKAQAQMRSLAFEDVLTGLSNRRLLQDRLEQALRSARRQGRAVALLYLDLDDFKRINDSFGHDVGDQLLQVVARRLRDCLRGPDTLARLGGDEFAAVLEDLTDETGARIVAKKMLDAMRRPVQVPGHSMVVTASIGLTMAPVDGEEVSHLMRNADLAMYRGKARGGDTFSFFTEEMNLDAARRLRIENELRLGLAQHQFTEHFQPIVRLDDGAMVGVEALVRWNHPQLGLTLPGEFIAVAEDTGIIVPLGQLVLNDACTGAIVMQRHSRQPMHMAVNLSARQFREPDLPRMVAQALCSSGLDPALLELEITESLLMEDSIDVTHRLGELKSLGVSLTIDDFGTGYSSLAYLKRLPVDGVKIDRTFIEGIPRDSADSEIASAIIAMAHKLNLRVVAEGVETAQQLAFLRENGCEIYQGFLAGRPQSLEELVRRWMR